MVTNLTMIDDGKTVHIIATDLDVEPGAEITAAAEWAAMTDADKFAALKAACSAACALKPGNVRRAGWCKPVELVGDAWTRLEARLQRGDGRTLRELLLFAALDALHQEARENAHSVGGSTPTGKDEAGAGRRIDERAHARGFSGTTARPIEEAGEIRAAITAAARDDIDRAIIRGVAAGYTTADIGVAVGVSGQAVRKRLSAIRARITAHKSDTGAAMPARQ